MQHCAIYHALIEQDALRAENLMREHSYVVTLNQMLRTVFQASE